METVKIIKILAVLSFFGLFCAIVITNAISKITRLDANRRFQKIATEM